MNKDDLLPLVRKLEGFGPLSHDDKAVLEIIDAHVSRVAARTDLIREGDPPEGVFLILEGFAGRYKLRANGERQIMALLVPGDFCDLDVMLLSQMDHSIASLSACRVARIVPEVIEELLQRPSLARAMRMATLVDAATAREWLVNVGRRSALERIAHLLYELLLRLETVGLAEGDSYHLPLTQAELADTTGMTNVHVNRSLRDLKAAGLIDIKRRHLAILNRPGLEVLAEFRSNYLHQTDRDAAYIGVAGAQEAIEYNPATYAP